MTIRSDLVNVHGVAMRVQRSGSGEPMLFLHGAAGVRRWLPLFAKLAEQFELIVPDHPGFGASEDPAWIRNVGDVAMLYLELFDALELDRVHVVGHSLGGWIAAEAGVRDCSRFRSATLIAPAGVRQPGVPPGDPFFWSAEQAVRNLYFDQRLAEEELSHKPTSEELDVILKNRFTFAKLAWQPRLFNPDLEKWLGRLRVPVQLIWGADDKVIPAVYAEVWERRLPKARLARLEQCGHLPQVERADDVLQVIQRFAKEAGQ